jgi:hypothetical protein
VRTDVAVMYACGLREVAADRSPAHVVLPETLAQFRSRLNHKVVDDLGAIQVAAAMKEGLDRPAHLLVDTFPAEQGSQRVTDATTLYKAQKKPATYRTHHPTAASSHDHIATPSVCAAPDPAKGHAEFWAAVSGPGQSLRHAGTPD